MWFGNGSRPSGVLTHPLKVSPEGKKNMKQSWEDAQSGLSNAHRVAILEEGVTWQQIGIPPEDAQFLETRKFQTSEVARWFKVPPHMIGDLERATFSNIEQQSMDFVMHTVRPWVVRWEQVLNWEMFNDRERDSYFSEFLLDALLRGDSASRGAFYQSLFQIGALSPNDALARENMNPVEGGDRRFIPANMVPLDAIDKHIDSLSAPKAAPPAPAKADEDEGEKIRSGFERVIRATAEDVIRREAKAIRSALDKAETRGIQEFYGWLDEFYGPRAEILERTYLPALLGMAEALGDASEADVSARVRELSESEVHESETAIRSLLLRTPAEQQIDAVWKLVTEWERSRPTAIATREARRSTPDNLPLAA